MGKAKKDVLGGSAFFLGGVLIILASFSIEGRTVESFIDAKFFPRLIGVLLLVASLCTILAGVRAWRERVPGQGESGAKDDPIPGQDKGRPVFVTFVLLCLYAVLLEPLGFILTSFLYLVLQFMVLSGRERWNLPLFMGVSASVSVLVYFAFLKAFNLMLPAGILG